MITKRSVIVSGHRTSVSLEPMFWDELMRLARLRGVSLNALVAEIDAARTDNLSSALRQYVLQAVKAEPASDPADDAGCL